MRKGIGRKEVNPGPDERSYCSDCRSKEDMITFLKQELIRSAEDKRRLEERVDKLNDKLILFSQQASDHEHRLRLTQLAHMKPAPLEGVVPRDDLILDDMSYAAGNLMDEISSSFK